MAFPPALPPRFDSAELIARGGMAEVYRARDTALERLVAVKVLARPLADDAEVRRRFVREAQIAATLSGSRHVVTVYDVGETPSGPPFIVMELLEGGTLADRLQRGPVPPAQALDWLEQAARGLDAAHARGIVHRDVKPGNLMLTAEGEVQVTDFGIARAPDTTLTLTGTVFGTSGYMAPEQARGEPATAASDRYALAVVAFELLAGRRPFVGETPASEAWAHATRVPPAASSLNDALPTPVDEVLAHGLAKDPEARPGSCRALVDALRNAFRTSEPSTRRSDPTVPPAHSGRRRTGTWIAAVLGLGVLAATGAGVASLLGEPA
ncbi:MAG: serine/threonine-protein kinase, partial [Gaiella sp.]